MSNKHKLIISWVAFAALVASTTFITFQNTFTIGGKISQWVIVLFVYGLIKTLWKHREEL